MNFWRIEKQLPDVRKVDQILDKLEGGFCQDWARSDQSMGP
jgi:hypothetical protein